MARDIKYYLYVSKSKVDMLSSQLRPRFLDRVSGFFEVNVLVAKTSLKQDAATENLYANLARLRDYLTDHAEIGTVDDPEDYFFGEGVMGWGTWQNTETGEPEHVFFTLSSGDTLVVLAGSAGNLVGNLGVELRSRSDLTDILMFLDGVAKESVPALGRTTAEIARRAYDHLTATSLAYQRVEFLAKRLAHFEIDSGENVLIGSPIFVALAD